MRWRIAPSMGQSVGLLVGLFAVGALLLPTQGVTATKKTPPSTYQHTVLPLVHKYCVACHTGNNPPAGISLDAFKDEVGVLKSRTVWEQVSQNLTSGRMPPKSAPQPTAAQRASLVTWIDTRLTTADCKVKDPGHVTLRRLNRAEYNNTIRDLMGVDFHPADDFPSDDVGYGFDNIGDVLSISPLLIEKYLTAAEKIANQAIVVDDPNKPVVAIKMLQLPDGDGGKVYNNYGRILANNSAIRFSAKFPNDGEYVARIDAFGQQAGTEPAKMLFSLDDKPVQSFDVPSEEAKPGTYEVHVKTTAGTHIIALAFTNDYYDEKFPDPKRRDRNLVIGGFEAVGPVDAKPREYPESHQRIFITMPTADTHEARQEAAQKILTAFATRAYRRPATATEIGRLLRYVDMAEKEGEPFSRGIQVAVEAVLTSPNFLFRVELDRDPTDPSTHALNDYELASRLSYFLWSSTPDDQLLQLAAANKLHVKTVLEAQVRRMLQDPKSHALVENFGDQWLTLRNLANVSPDPARFPDFNEGLRADMLKETEMFFESVMREDRSILDFIDGNYTFLDERLAKHYGITTVQGDQFRKVLLTDGERGGLLTQASILTVTSNPTRTSPVKRGKWVLEQFLGTPPPPPPPNVPQLKEAGMLVGTLRQRMEQHRKDPACASCHARMDPLGFGLENFDAVGAWRTQDGGQPIDTSGKLPDGRTFQGAKGLKLILKKQKDLFARNLAEKMLTYALGRGTEYYDQCALDDMEKTVAKSGYKFSALVLNVVKSDPFLKRRGEGVEK